MRVLLCISGAAIIWTGIEPLALLIIASVGGVFAIFFYSGLLIRLNTKHLPEQIKPRGWRIVFMPFRSCSTPPSCSTSSTR